MENGMDKLREAIWSAAGWGSPYCEICKGDLVRFPVRGGAHTYCPREECIEIKKKQEEERSIPYWWTEDQMIESQWRDKERG